MWIAPSQRWVKTPGYFWPLSPDPPANNLMKTVVFGWVLMTVMCPIYCSLVCSNQNSHPKTLFGLVPLLEIFYRKLGKACKPDWPVFELVSPILYKHICTVHVIYTHSVDYPKCQTHIFHQHKTVYDFSQKNSYQSITGLMAYILPLTASF